MGKQKSNGPMSNELLEPVRIVNDAAFVVCKAQGQIPHSTLGSCSQLMDVRSHGGADLRERAPADPRSRV